MVVKSLTITEDAYKLLKSWKHGDESFSELILRLGHSRAEHLKKFCGILKRSEKEVHAWEKEIKEARIKSTASMEHKLKKIKKSVQDAY